MKTRLILFLSIILSTTALFAQDYQKHTVLKGETVKTVAKKHSVTPYDIYRLNPDAKNGIKENMILLIPANGVVMPLQPVKEKPTKVVNTVHVLQESETFYSLSKKYSVTVADIEKANPGSSKDDLQIGQEIIIPIKGSAVDAQVKKAEKIDAKKHIEAYIYHTVSAGETKYSIARDFDMTLQLLEELNPEVKDILPLGYELKLVNKKVVNNQPVVTTNIDDKYMIYIVRAKETFYNLGKKTGLTAEQIIALNPEAKDGLKEGMQLKLPKATIFIEGATEASAITDLTQSLIRTQSKQIALLIPFNMERLETDTIRAQLIRNDKFLNMTLDFYSGALMAIDSADVLGLPLKVKILDSKESRNSSAVSSLRNKLVGSDAVIGPFFPGNTETTASLLGNVPVLSPLSREYGAQYTNLLQSVPSSEYAKEALLNYLFAKGGNILAVIDAKKESSKKYLQQNYPTVKLVPVSAGGIVNESVLKNMMVKDRTNYILLETERAGTAINVTKMLTAALDEYPIQLAVPENNEMYENAEISINSLTALKMLYPSVTNDSQNDRKNLFIKVFSDKYGYMPNQFAIRGFDVTFDVIMRLFQPEPFNTVIGTVASEQVENKFMYNIEGGSPYNTGVYIMQYDEGLTVIPMEFYNRKKTTEMLPEKDKE